MIDNTHFNRAKESWEQTDKNTLGEDDIPYLVRLVELLFALATVRGDANNGNHSTTLDS